MWVFEQQKNPTRVTVDNLLLELALQRQGVAISNAAEPANFQYPLRHLQYDKIFASNMTGGWLMKELQFAAFIAVSMIIFAGATEAQKKTTKKTSSRTATSHAALPPLEV